MKNKIVFIIICAFLILGYAQKGSYAQLNIQTSTKEVDYSPRKDVQEKMRREPLELPSVIKEKEKLPQGEMFFIKTIELEGVVSIPLLALTPIVSQYENRDVSLGELNELTTKIQMKYLEHGIITACFLPEQKIKEGKVILKVVEAKMGELEIAKHKYYREGMLRHYWDIKRGDVLRYDRLYRSLQLMNKNPDRKVTSDLRAGKKAEETDVKLDVDTKFPVHATSAYDNEGSKFTGFDRRSFGLRHNNLLGLDDILMSGISYGSNFESIYGYHRIPVTSSGASLMYGHSFSYSSPKKEYSILELESRSRSSSVFISQDLYNGANYAGETSFGCEAKDKSTKALGQTINWDRLRILKLNGAFNIKSRKSATYIQPELSQGINSFGARRRNPLSSRDTGNVFTMFTLGVENQLALPWSLGLNTKLKGQAASVKLPSSEVFYLGGMDSVRGYPSGDFFADSGVQANVEVLIPEFILPKNFKLPFDKTSLKENFSWLVFYDYGYGKKRGGPFIENPTGNLSSVGGGFRVQLFSSLFVRSEWGVPLTDRPISESSKTRFHLSFDYQY